jgi:hypothetical protein
MNPRQFAVLIGVILVGCGLIAGGVWIGIQQLQPNPSPFPIDDNRPDPIERRGPRAGGQEIKLGARAARAGIDAQANPYRHDDDRAAAWLEGFMDALGVSPVEPWRRRGDPIGTTTPGPSGAVGVPGPKEKKK